MEMLFMIYVGNTRVDYFAAVFNFTVFFKGVLASL